MLKELADDSEDYRAMSLQSIEVTFDAEFFHEENGEKIMETYSFFLNDGRWSSLETNCSKSVLQFAEYEKSVKGDGVGEWQTIERRMWDDDNEAVDLPQNVVREVSERLDAELLVVE